VALKGNKKKMPDKMFLAKSRYKHVAIPTDKVVLWSKDKKLWILSNTYYGSPFYDYLILAANSRLGGHESEWGEGDSVLIPYPLNAALSEYMRYVEEDNQNDR
jgi:hypothetical protein